MADTTADLGATLNHLPAQRCLYVGDDLRDIEAGRAAGMGTVVALGLPGRRQPLEEWGADTIIQSPAELLRLVAQGSC